MRTDVAAGSSTSRGWATRHSTAVASRRAGWSSRSSRPLAAERRPSGQVVDDVGRVAASVLVGGFNQLLVDWLAGRMRIGREQLIEDATALFVALGDAAAAIAAQRTSTH